LVNESIKELREKYNQGVNISIYLREKYGTTNIPEIIEISYDLQAGSYTELMKNPEHKKWREESCTELAKTIELYCSNYNSILEAGIGEGQHLSGILNNLKKPLYGYGFDISWSRIMYAKDWLKTQNCKDFTLFTGDLLNIPCLDNAVDIVYTNQAIEPNRGKEEIILKELYRVAKKYLFLLEPSYELANTEAKARMEKMGYIKNLCGIAKELGYKVLEYKLFSVYNNPLNPVSIIVIEKDDEIQEKRIENIFACPQFKTILQKQKQTYFSSEAMRIYPIIEDIPCLRIENSILASKYLDFVK
jgi:ubiquinone/menaquinone biosynthesis C-methylase UbiE